MLQEWWKLTKLKGEHRKSYTLADFMSKGYNLKVKARTHVTSSRTSAKSFF
jgi:hypothetical protein